LHSYDCLKTEFISAMKMKSAATPTGSSAKGNAVCVLPGKFSFFATVAYQSYWEIKNMIGFKEAARERYAADQDCQDGGARVGG